MPWTPVANFVEQELSSEQFDDAQVHVTGEVWSRDAGVTMQLRLWNTTLNASAGESAEVAGVTPTDASFVATLATGWNTYRLEVGSDTPSVEVFAMGTLGLV